MRSTSVSEKRSPVATNSAKDCPSAIQRQFLKGYLSSGERIFSTVGDAAAPAPQDLHNLITGLNEGADGLGVVHN